MRPFAALALLVSAALAGCGVSGPGMGAGSAGPAQAPTSSESTGSLGADHSSSSDADEDPSSGSGAFPLTVTSCGVETTLDAPPQRIVTIKSSATEMVLALGAGDRLVGTAFSDGDLPHELASAGADLPVLAEKNPGAESVLELEPDLVYAGWESNLSADGAGERSMYESLGISTWVSPSACKAPEHQPDRLTFDHVFAEIEQVGTILGEPDTAAKLIAQQRAALAEVSPSDDGLSGLWYSSGEDAPYVGAGIGAPQMIMDAVGLENVAGSVADTWTTLGWESVAEADPDVIVLVDAPWNSAEDKIARLEANPVTASLAAVRDRRYLTVPFPATEAGMRNVPAVVDLAHQLEKLQVKP